jgi:long-chain acyl-CoA synthetase
MSENSASHGVDGKNLSDLIANRAAKSPKAPAFMSKRNGAWQTTTWQEAYERASDIAHGLLHLGLSIGDRVAIIGNTREEWSLCDFGLVLGGGVTVPIYPSSPKDTVAFILRDSESSWVIVENDKQLAKLLPLRKELSGIKQVILWDGHVDGNEQARGWVTTLHELIEAGRQHQLAHKDALIKVRDAVPGDAIATLIYTSGTTGNPKGVIIAHDAFTVGCRYIAGALPVSATDRHVLFLPLSHSFAKAIELAAVKVGFCTAFAESIDKLADNCGEVKPTFVCAVPRVFEKAYAKVLNSAKEGGAVKWAIFQRALDVGIRWSRELQAGRKPSGLLALQYAVADKLVFSKLRQRFGGQLRYFISGSAPLSKDLAEFFHAAGMLILEGYGLTETNSMTSVNRIDKFKFGTVGPMLHPDLRIRLASDGEILTKGVTNLRGYYKNETATREAIDEEGWFHTGDIGEIDEDGFIKITDRKKDLIKTSGGKYVAPQMIEGQLKMEPVVSQVVVIGDQRKYVTALVALNLDVAKKLLSEAGQPTAAEDEIYDSALVKERVQAKLDELNKKLGSWEQVKYFRVLPRELSEAEGELTPTLKVKRKVVSERYREVIDSMYQDKGGDKGGDRD